MRFQKKLDSLREILNKKEEKIHSNSFSNKHGFVLHIAHSDI